MKAYKIGFFISFLLLFWSICYTPENKVVADDLINSIKQSPLSDDQTDPVNSNNTIEFTEIDWIKNNEPIILSSNPIFFPVICFKLIEGSHPTDKYTSAINCNYPSGLHHILRSSNSYLKVFRI